MNTLSKASEDKIIAAVKRAVESTNAGAHPTDAIEKEARADRWGPDFVRFACHAMNVGRQTAQRESATTALAKFASFDLADAEAVIGRMWPRGEQAVKAAADALKPKTVSFEYDRPPQWPALKQQMEKAARLNASIKQAADAAAANLPATPPLSAQVAYNRYHAFKQASTEARYQAGAADTRLNNAVRDLRGYFNHFPNDRLPATAVIKAAAAKYGDAPVTALMAAVGISVAMTHEKSAGLIEVDDKLQPWSLVKACFDRGVDLTVSRTASAAADQALTSYVTGEFAPFVTGPITTKAASSLLQEPDVVSYDPRQLAPFLPPAKPVIKQAEAPLPEPQPWSLLDGVKQAGFGDAITAGAAGAGAKGLLDSALGRGDAGTQVQDAYNDLEDPAHDSMLRSIRTQAMLADLMNDPIIGAHDPEKVMQAYNEISQMGPRAASQPLAVRSLLRDHLSRDGAAGPHEVEQVTNLEKGLMGTSTNPPPPSALRPPATPKQAFDDTYAGIMTDDVATSIFVN